MNNIKTINVSLIRMSFVFFICLGIHHSSQAQIQPFLKLVDSSEDRLEHGIWSDVRFFPDGKKILTTGNVAKIWNLESGKTEFVFRGHNKYNPGIGFGDISPDGKFVITGGSTTRVIVWKVETGEELLTFQTFPEQAPFYANVAFFPDGKKIIAYDSRHIQVWDIESQTMLKEFDNPGTELSPLAFFNDGERILLGHNPARIISLENGAILQQFDNSRAYLNHQNGRIYLLKKEYNISGSRTYNIFIMNDQMVDIDYSFPNFILDRVEDVGFTPDFKFFLAALEKSPTIQVIKLSDFIDVKSSMELVTDVEDSVDTGFARLRISPDGKKAAAIAQEAHTVYIWDISNLTSSVQAFDSTD